MRSNVTGVGHYNSEYRGFNRGYGRGNSKPFQKFQPQRSPQPSRRGDLFVEAGRLAVDYLVTHGLLSSNVLSGKSPSSTLRNSSQDSKDHHISQDNELPNSPANGRSVGLTNNQENASTDRVSGTMKPLVVDDRRMFRSSSSEIRKVELSRHNSSEWSPESIKLVSLPDKVTSSHNMEDDNKKILNDTTKDADYDVKQSHLVESSSNDDRDCKPVDESNNCNHDSADSDSKMPSMIQNKVDEEVPKNPDSMDIDAQETKDGNSSLDMDKETSRDKLDIDHCEEMSNDASSQDGVDLLKLCATAKIPTKVRSSLINKSPKNDSLLVSDEQSTSDTGCDSIDFPKDVTINGSPNIPPSSEIPTSHCVGTSLCEPSSAGAAVLDPAYAVTQQKPAESESFNDKTFSYEQKSGEISKDRGEKRALEVENMGEGTKRAKPWLSVAQSNGYSQFSDLSEKQSILPTSKASHVNMFKGVTQETFTNVSLTIKDGGESSSFKICDLNLMESSDIPDNHDVPSFLYPSISAPNKDTSVGIDLSMNNSNLKNGYNDGSSITKSIEIIDLESEDLPESKNVPAKSMEPEITSMGNLPTQNLNNNPDGQDGYGLMFSGLLGNEDPNGSSTQPDINSLHNDVGLHHGEGMFSEDDQIYMSLGEIPMSLLPVWEQPPQGRNPFEL